jgi:muconate cycloisomerase
MLNLRLSKNGGLFRVLSLAREADASGLAYQLGCMVGETGILSALGRMTASLLPRAVYLEGGYDDVLLAGNVTTRSFGFGPGGRAEIVRGRGIGYEVDEQALAKFSRARLSL